jgi:hypothetical protein
MENPTTRLIVYSTLMTLGVVLMLLGISWLMFLGLALVMLAEFLSSRRRGLRGFLLWAAAAIAILLRDLHNGNAFVQGPKPLLLGIVLGGVWLWAVASEFQRWRTGGKSRTVRDW